MTKIQQQIRKACQTALGPKAKAQVPACEASVSESVARQVSQFCSAQPTAKLQKTCRNKLEAGLWKGAKPNFQARAMPANIPTTHESVKGLIEAESYAIAAPNKDPVKPKNPKLPSEEKILVRQPLGRLIDEKRSEPIRLTPSKNWVEIQTTLPLPKRHLFQITFSYWLEQNNDGSFTLYWRQNTNTSKPNKDDKQITFSMSQDSKTHRYHYPAGLELILVGKWETEGPAVEELQFFVRED